VKISKRGEYALRALIDFGLAKAADRPLLQASEIASKEDFPVAFLEQILMQLKAECYIESRRGKNGGYFLARPLENICIGQVIRSMARLLRFHASAKPRMNAALARPKNIADCAC
jgi:Rrf2 family protein